MWKSLDWLRSFLSNRSQFVEIYQQRSCSLDVKIGIPKSSTLGPLLFIMHINDFNKSLRILKSIHFAEDTTLYLDINPSNDHTTLINFELAQVQTWINANKFSLNVKKKLTTWLYQTETKLKT